MSVEPVRNGEKQCCRFYNPVVVFTTRTCSREGTPGADPGLGGRGIGKPGIVGGEDDVLLTPNTSEGRASGELDEVVDAGDSAGRIRTRIRRVRAVMLATLQEKRWVQAEMTGQTSH